MANTADQQQLDHSELRFDLTLDESNDYLKTISPQGIGCPVCDGRDWGSAVHGGKTASGQEIHRVFPEGVFSHADLKTAGMTDIQNAMRNSARSYSYMCTNCGYQMKFLAGMVAARIALKKKKAA